MKEIRRMLLLLTEEKYKEEFQLIKDWIPIFPLENLWVVILAEDHDYYILESTQPENIQKEVNDFVQKEISFRIINLGVKKINEINKIILKDNIDTVIAFNHDQNDWLDEYILQLVSRSSANIILFPDIKEFEFKKILIATDFSNNSKEALLYGMYLKELKKDIELKVIHIAAVPVGYHATGLSLDEFSIKVKESAVQKMKSFLPSDYDIPYEIFSVYKHKNVSPEIMRIASLEKTDLLLLGSQGIGSPLEILYPGSTTIKIIHNHTLPVFIVKMREKQKSLLERILFPA